MQRPSAITICMSRTVWVCYNFIGGSNLISINFRNNEFFVGSIRQTLELSMTKQPTSANFGAHSKEVCPPAENIAIIVGFWIIALHPWINTIFLTLEFYLFAHRFSKLQDKIFIKWKLKFFNTYSSYTPTKPVTNQLTASFMIKLFLLLLKTITIQNDTNILITFVDITLLL